MEAQVERNRWVNTDTPDILEDGTGSINYPF
jgi:hypothetical protein